MNLKINADHGRYWTGLGDSVCLSWLYAGAKDTDSPIDIYATGKRAELLNFLGVDVTDDPSCSVIPAEAYQVELNEGGLKPRLDYLREYLSIKTLAKRPTHRIRQSSMQWGYDTAKANGGKVILLFPQSHWKPRQLPVPYWIDLSYMLRELGYSTILMTEGQPPELENVALRFYNYAIEDIAGLMLHSALVIGNDSMPAHLASSLGVKTLAVMGPTKPEVVFGHTLDVVTPLQSSCVECSGCHFKPIVNGKIGWRAACDQGCVALYSILPNDIKNKVKDLLKIA